MPFSNEVNALRKSGALDKAYAMALQILKEDPGDEYNIKSLVYCLNDLIKRAVSQNDYKEAQGFASRLETIIIDEDDDILLKTVRNAKLIANPQKKIIIEAKQLSFEGKDQLAYPLFKKAFLQYPNDSDLAKSYGWTIYKLLKKAIESKDKEYRDALLLDCRIIETSIGDEKLLQSLKYIKDLADDQRQIIREAKENSRNGNHKEALRLFREAIIKFPDDNDLNEQFAWALYKEGQNLIESEIGNVHSARQLLAEYIKLKNERPSPLHSLFLRLASKIIDREEFNLVSFLRLWDLKYLREEDFIPFKKDEKTYPSIAEKVIQHGAKLILDKKTHQEVDYFLPFLDMGIARFQDNIWLTYYKAKILHLINRKEEAIEFLIPVIKEKISEYWSWSFLGDLLIESDMEKAFSCYCKSLLCKGEEKFLTNVRIKLVELLIQKEQWNEAKFEIEAISKAKEAEGAKVSDRLTDYLQKEWYNSAVKKNSNIEFYHTHKQLAEEITFNSLPWFNGCIGDTYIIPEKPDKPRRRLFIQLQTKIIEVSVSDKKYNISRNYREGDAIRVKGESNKDDIFQLYLLEKRISTETYDLFEWYKGNITYQVKNDANKILEWKISTVLNDQLKEGTLSAKNTIEMFPTNDGTPVFVKIYQEKINRRQLLTHSDLKKPRVHFLSIIERKDGQPWDLFPNHIGIVDHINIEKGIAHFLVSKEIDGIIKLNDLKEKVEVGDNLLVKLKHIVKDGYSYYTVLSCILTQHKSNQNLVKYFHGKVKMLGTIGFAEDVFIDSSLIEDHEIQDGFIVSGQAIINFNKKKGSWGWKAVKISPNYVSSENESSVNDNKQN